MTSTEPVFIVPNAWWFDFFTMIPFLTFVLMLPTLSEISLYPSSGWVNAANESLPMMYYAQQSNAELTGYSISWYMMTPGASGLFGLLFQQCIIYMFLRPISNVSGIEYWAIALMFVGVCTMLGSPVAYLGAYHFPGVLMMLAGGSMYMGSQMYRAQKQTLAFVAASIMMTIGIAGAVGFLIVVYQNADTGNLYPFEIACLCGLLFATPIHNLVQHLAVEVRMVD
tara:strand:- start:1477 stop:2151 length:675 start_codon:yes stop_codon:yes gene_type:complete